jgi:hypothetical protein
LPEAALSATGATGSAAVPAATEAVPASASAAPTGAPRKMGPLTAKKKGVWTYD